MNYRELVFRICDVNVLKNSMSAESKQYYISKQIQTMLEKEMTLNHIQNEAYERAYFNIVVLSNQKIGAKGRIQNLNEVILPALIDAGISEQDIKLIKTAFDERKLLIKDENKRTGWNTAPIPVLNY